MPRKAPKSWFLGFLDSLITNLEINFIEAYHRLWQEMARFDLGLIVMATKCILS